VKSGACFSRRFSLSVLMALLGVIDRYIAKALSDFKNVFANYKNSVSWVICSFISWYIVPNWLHTYGHQFTFQLFCLSLIFEKADDVPVLLPSNVIKKELAGFIFGFRTEYWLRVATSFRIKHNPLVTFFIKTEGIIAA
jgi:hypothetical protein